MLDKQKYLHVSKQPWDTSGFYGSWLHIVRHFYIATMSLSANCPSTCLSGPHSVFYSGSGHYFIWVRALFWAPSKSPSFSVKLTLPLGVALLYLFSLLPFIVSWTTVLFRTPTVTARLPDPLPDSSRLWRRSQFCSSSPPPQALPPLPPFSTQSVVVGGLWPRTFGVQAVK
jgi:hypothetical protein